jgi:hypothetical protein
LDAMMEKKSSTFEQLSLVKAQYDAAVLSLGQRQSQV